MSTPKYVDPVILPADIESMALYFLTPILNPTPVSTRLPVTTNQSYPNGYMRVEAGGGSKVNFTEYDLPIILHAYGASVTDDMQAAHISRTAMAYMTAARGQNVMGWYVVGITHTIMSHRLTDPDVSLLRYRSLVTWRVTGQQVPGTN